LFIRSEGFKPKSPFTGSRGSFRASLLILLKLFVKKTIVIFFSYYKIENTMSGKIKIHNFGREQTPEPLADSAVFIGSLLLASFFFIILSCSAVPPEEDSSTDSPNRLHINLKELKVYIKRGFDYSGLTELPEIPARPEDGKGTSEWIVIEPSESSQNAPLLMRDKWPDIPRRLFLSPGGEKEEEFTLLFPFELSRDELVRLKTDTGRFPGIFFAGLGNNWAVFLNGVENRSEIHLNGSGNIVSHRRWHHVFFPLDKSEFTAGANILGIRLIGAPSSESTGLFFTGPYYIGDYLDMESDKNEAALMVICSIYLFVGVYHLLLWAGYTKERYNLFYSLFALMLAVFLFISKSHIVYFFIPESNILDRAACALAFILVPVISAFFEDFTFRKIGRATVIYGIFCLFCALTGIFFSMQYVEDIMRVWQLITFFALIYFFGRNVIYAFLLTVQRRWEKTERKTSLFNTGIRSLWETPLGNLMIGTTVMFITVLIDGIDFFLFRSDSFVSIYGFSVFVIGATLTLIRRFHYLNRALEQSKANLEDKVRKRTEELEAQTQIAKKASLAKSDFLANMSHEIRTPMNAIIGMVELILRRDISADVYADALGIKHAGANLLAIINDILDFSKIESGRMELAVVDYRLDSLINDCISIIRVRLTEKPLLFIVDVDSALPNELRGDEIRIRQILINLLSNAVKFTQTGHIALRISAPVPVERGSNRDAGSVVIHFAVEDTGQGIKAEDMDRLFNDFTRFDSHRNRGIEGTGLGLAISRQLSRLMGGDITVRSVYGEGSTFTAILPQKIVNPTPLAIVDSPAEKFSLVFETRQTLANSFAYSLQNLGIAVQVVTTENAFFRELEKPLTGKMYPYVFVPGAFAEKAANCIETRQISTSLVAVLDLGDPVPPGKQRNINLPVFTISLANIFNGPPEELRREKSHTKFVAPDARILVVDDNRTNLVVAKGLLSPYRMNISLCSSGREAVALAQRNHYDIIFMDHMMPGMDGVEATAAIRALDGDWFRDIPIIALTANAVAGMKEEYLSKGFSDFVSKPIEIPKLEEVMDRWIPQEKQRQDVQDI
jgi:signal transduction histidine kinase/CheY-like chemotaxis protein